MRLENNISIIGNLTADPRRTEYPNGTVKTTFKVAVNHIKGDDADYFWVKTWGKLAETCAANLGKGSEVGVGGELNSFRKTNDDGTFTETVDINAQNVKFLRRPKGATAPAVEAPLPEAPDAEAVAATPASDDIPF